MFQLRKLRKNCKNIEMNNTFTSSVFTYCDNVIPKHGYFKFAFLQFDEAEFSHHVLDTCYETAVNMHMKILASKFPEIFRNKPYLNILR